MKTQLITEICQEQTILPETYNSLISYETDDYSAGKLSKDLTGKGETQYGFSSEFEDNNYIDGVWLSNPVISKNYSFPEMYRINIHNTTGIYNNYVYKDGEPTVQNVLVKNELVGYTLEGSEKSSSYISSSGGGLANNGGTLTGVTPKEMAYILSNWDEYISLNMQPDSQNYGINQTYKLPVIDREGISSIQVAFDASVILSSSYLPSQEYPLSLQIYNFNYNGGQGRWESIKLSDDYNFWKWKSQLGQIGNEFRPGWSSTSLGEMQTVSFGSCFPPVFTPDPYNVDFNSYIKAGSNFLYNDHC